MSNRLSFYFFPSPYGIDWSSPAALAWSTLLNRMNWVPRPAHPIGHVNIALSELTYDGSELHRLFLTGMVAKETSYQRQALLRDQLGLGILFLSSPGHLETEEEIEPQFEARYPGGKLSVLKLLVNDTVRSRLKRYFSEFQEKRGFHSYGLANRPLWLEGAGCSAFAASFLQVAGLELPEFRENWTRELRIPQALIGGAENPGNRVPLTRILFDRRSRWAEEGEPHRKIFFWDPDLMHRWLLRTWEALDEGRGCPIERPFTLSRTGNTLEVEFDLSHLRAPEGPIWADGVL
jgi:hypothetical protein